MLDTELGLRHAQQLHQNKRTGSSGGCQLPQESKLEFLRVGSKSLPDLPDRQTKKPMTILLCLTTSTPEQASPQLMLVWVRYLVGQGLLLTQTVSRPVQPLLHQGRCQRTATGAA